MPQIYKHFSSTPYASIVYISNSESKSRIKANNKGMENIKQRVMCYSNIVQLHVELKWNKKMKMEGNKCCSQMGWLVQKPICKISIRIIEPLKVFQKEVPMDIKTALLS
jgi:hypothetical protein